MSFRSDFSEDAIDNQEQFKLENELELIEHDYTTIEAILPKVLYHYTSYETLEKIVKNKTWRFSSINGTNDLSENLNLYVKDLLIAKNLCCELPQNIKLNIINQINNQIYYQYNDYCIACFTDQYDDLGQWRIKYGDYGRGVCIGINPKFFTTKEFNENTFGWGKIIYEISKQKQKINSILKEYEKPDKVWEIDNAVDLALDIRKAALVMKHKAFNIEHEYRMICPILDNEILNDNFIKITKQNFKPITSKKIQTGKILSYIDFDISSRRILTSENLFTSILLGKNCPKTITDVTKLLQENNFKCDNIKRSKIPYRFDECYDRKRIK